MFVAPDIKLNLTKLFDIVSFLDFSIFGLED